MGWANWLFKANEPEAVRELYTSPQVLKMQDIEKDENDRFRVIR